jgi:hypothetical protein
MADHSASTRFRSLFESALAEYEKKTGITLAEHPLAIQLQSCHSIESTTALLQGQAQAFSKFRGRDRAIKSINNTLSILTTLSDTAILGDSIGLVRHNLLVVYSTALTVFFSALLTCEGDTRWSRHPSRCMFCSPVPMWLSFSHHVNQAAKGVLDSYDALVDLLESIEHFLKRLDIYTRIPATAAMDEIVVKIMVELLTTLALATKEIKQGKSSKSVITDV